MKNVKDIQKEIDSINKELQLDLAGKIELKPSQIKAKNKRKDYLKTCIRYLSTNPTKEFIEKEKERLLNRNDLIMRDLPKEEKFTDKEGVLDLVTFKKAKKDYEKLMNLPHIRLQLRTLQFIS